jgi:hypothetical protein
MKKLEGLQRRFSRCPKRVERCIVEEGDIRARPFGEATECHSQWCRLHGTENRRIYRQTHPKAKRKRDLPGSTAPRL